MQRRPRTYVISAALAITLAGGLTGCSGASDDGADEDTKPGSTGSATSSAVPGKYNTLPEPCGSVNQGTLKSLLPSAEPSDSGSGSGEEGESPYEGEAKLTYDTDRQVGCKWKSANPEGTRHLSVDMERVVSYDPSVSDDEQAGLLYDERAGQAEIPSSGTSSPKQSAPAGSGSQSPQTSQSPQAGESPRQGDGTQGGRRTWQNGQASQGSQSGQGGQDSQSGQANSSAQPGAPSSSASPSAGSGGASPSGSPSATEGKDLSPRTLTGIGDSAYINDQLDTGNSGVHRDITLVFRTSNVIATVRYNQWVADKNGQPDSAELQDKATAVARELAARLDEG